MVYKLLFPVVFSVFIQSFFFTFTLSITFVYSGSFSYFLLSSQVNYACLPFESRNLFSFPSHQFACFTSYSSRYPIFFSVLFYSLVIVFFWYAHPHFHLSLSLQCNYFPIQCRLFLLSTTQRQSTCTSSQQSQYHLHSLFPFYFIEYYVNSSQTCIHWLGISFHRLCLKQVLHVDNISGTIFCFVNVFFPFNISLYLMILFFHCQSSLFTHLVSVYSMCVGLSLVAVSIYLK